MLPLWDSPRLPGSQYCCYERPGSTTFFGDCEGGTLKKPHDQLKGGCPGNWWIFRGYGTFFSWGGGGDMLSNFHFGHPPPQKKKKSSWKQNDHFFSWAIKRNFVSLLKEFPLSLSPAFFSERIFLKIPVTKPNSPHQKSEMTGRQPTPPSQKYQK